MRLPLCFSLEAHLLSVYNEAIAVKTRQGAPVTSYSIQRRAVNNYMKTISTSSIQSPICLICACKFPYVSSRKENDINWRMPFEATSVKDKRILRFMNQRRADVESMFGLETYLENYGCIQKKKVHLADDEYIEEFDDWLLTIPFAERKR